jgi:Cytochrome P450
MDNIIQAGAVPSYNDVLKMSLLQACVRETIRLHHAGPLGLPHATSKNDI